MKSTQPEILIIGASGMLGHTVFNYFKQYFPESTWGTTRTNKLDKNIIIFDAQLDERLQILDKNFNKLDYIINCSGILPSNKNLNEMNYINAMLPHNLSTFAEEKNAKLIHISSDAVFPRLVMDADEDTPPSPENFYGETKLRGEPNSMNAITFRTSILGLDPYQHKGLLEWVIQTRDCVAYTNQYWSGCTTYQYASLCYRIIISGTFNQLRSRSRIFHFPPIAKIAKRDIITSFLKLSKNEKVVRTAIGEPLNRILITKYRDLLKIKNQQTLEEALEDLINFERKHTK